MNLDSKSKVRMCSLVKSLISHHNCPQFIYIYAAAHLLHFNFTVDQYIASILNYLPYSPGLKSRINLFVRPRPQAHW